MSPAKKALAAIEKAEAARWSGIYFGEVFDKLFAIAVIDPAGIIRYANNLLHTLARWPGETLIGEPLDVLVPKDIRLQHKKYRLDFQKTSDMRPMGPQSNVTLVCKDGAIQPACVSLTSITGGDVMAVILPQWINE